MSPFNPSFVGLLRLFLSVLIYLFQCVQSTHGSQRPCPSETKRQNSKDFKATSEKLIVR